MPFAITSSRYSPCGRSLWDVEMGVMDGGPGGDAHRGMIEGAAEYVADDGVSAQAHQRVVGRHLLIVAIGAGLREAVQLAAVQAVDLAGLQTPGHVGDVRAPTRLRTAGRRVHLKVYVRSSR